jgi:hypothetical protein
MLVIHAHNLVRACKQTHAQPFLCLQEYTPSRIRTIKASQAPSSVESNFRKSNEDSAWRAGSRSIEQACTTLRLLQYEFCRSSSQVQPRPEMAGPGTRPNIVLVQGPAQGPNTPTGGRNLGITPFLRHTPATHPQWQAEWIQLLPTP